jgi:hypothetical protein
MPDAIYQSASGTCALSAMAKLRLCAENAAVFLFFVSVPQWVPPNTPLARLYLDR